MKTKITRVHLGCWACLLVMLLLLVLQFSPFWHYNDGEAASISQYVWFPYKFSGVESMLRDALGDGYVTNQTVLGPVILLVGCTVGVIICLFKAERPYTPVIAALVGLAGIIGYLRTPALQLGMSWGIHLALCILLLVLGCITAWWRFQPTRAD